LAILIVPLPPAALPAVIGAGATIAIVVPAPISAAISAAIASAIISANIYTVPSARLPLPARCRPIIHPLRSLVLPTTAPIAVGLFTLPIRPIIIVATCISLCISFRTRAAAIVPKVPLIPAAAIE
jgi:hypothetical protein